MSERACTCVVCFVFTEKRKEEKSAILPLLLLSQPVRLLCTCGSVPFYFEVEMSHRTGLAAISHHLLLFSICVCFTQGPYAMPILLPLDILLSLAINFQDFDKIRKEAS